MSSSLNDDEVYTIELLIERVRSDIEGDDYSYDESSERSDARSVKAYRPNFDKVHVKPAFEKLNRLTWLSLQRLPDDKRPVRDLRAFQYLPNLKTLVLVNNEVTDLKPLASCTNLTELNLQDNPVTDLSPLESLVNLQELTLSASQIPSLRSVKSLPKLVNLELTPETFDSFEGLPEMPQLRRIYSAHANSLEGLEKYPKLENLVNFSGQIHSLEPLRGLKNLTHINLLSSSVRTLEPLSELNLLRDVSIDTYAREIDITPLSSLEYLHDVSIKVVGQPAKGIAELKPSLKPWDDEFKIGSARYSPSLNLEVVDEATFDHYNNVEMYNYDLQSMNAEMIQSELYWLDDQIEPMLASKLKEDEDYAVPYRGFVSRSRTIVLLSDKSVEQFPELVTEIQRILCNAKNDWIIFFQSDGIEKEFIVWIYPNKVVVTEKYAQTVRSLINDKN